MNNVTEEKKESLTKTLAIVGFLAVIIFAVWLAVQIVSILPNAFSSLASIADVVYNYNEDQELEVSTPQSVVNAGEAFTLSWTDMRKDGVYTFSYACIEGVSAEIRDTNGNITAVTCDTPIELGDVNDVEVVISSEKSRFIDVPYTITFSRGNGDTHIAGQSKITIVNATIPTSGLVEETEHMQEVEEETPNVSAPNTPAKPVTPTYTAGKPVTVTKYVYTTPVSDPNGKIDLQVTFLGVGTIVGKSFVPQSSVDADEQGAIQFEVKNIGTKTAADWSYKAQLPSSITYSSNDQKALKPNERAVITLGFEGVTKTGTQEVSVEITAKDDVKKSNNEFEKDIKIVD